MCHFSDIRSETSNRLPNASPSYILTPYFQKAFSLIAPILDVLKIALVWIDIAVFTNLNLNCPPPRMAGLCMKSKVRCSGILISVTLILSYCLCVNGLILIAYISISVITVLQSRLKLWIWWGSRLTQSILLISLGGSYGHKESTPVSSLYLFHVLLILLPVSVPQPSSWSIVPQVLLCWRCQ